MKAKKNWIVTIVLLSIFLAVVQVTQLASKADQKTTTTPQIKYTNEPREILAGLRGVYVLVRDFRPEVEKYGFNKQMYQTDVELRLRQYGVKVLSFEEGFLTAGQPYLDIYVLPLISEQLGIASVLISVQLREKVLLERNPTIMTHAFTWEKDMVLTMGLDKLDEIREYVKDIVALFINDYLAANPKEPEDKSKNDK